MTEIKADTNTRRAANFGFAAFLFVAFGWANLEVLLLKNNASIRAQLFTDALGIYLSIIAYRRCQFWRNALVLSESASGKGFASKAGIVGPAVALAAAGCVLSYFMGSDFVMPTAIGAAVFTFIPWSRSRFCREHFFISHALLVAGGLPVLIITGKHLPDRILLLHTWALWTLAAGLVLSALWLQRSAMPPPRHLQAEPKAYEAGMQ